MSRVQELEAAIQRIMDAWEGGDLAGAVNEARLLLPDPHDDQTPDVLYTGGIEARLTDEILVTIWPNGDCDVAFRSGLESWGPPQDLTEVQTR